jgi:hypothetical protein
VPRRVRQRAARARAELDAEALAAFTRELPPWLEDYLLYRTSPQRGTSTHALLEQLTVDPMVASGLSGLLRRTPLAKVWRHHRKALLTRWAAEGRKGAPFGARMDVDPYNPDPRCGLYGGSSV